MSRTAGVSVENNFVRGLVTEATGLNFPENAVTDSDNCVFERKGSVKRRLGIDYETGYTTTAFTETGVSIVYKWETVDNDGTRTFVVVQKAHEILFYATDGVSLSAGKKSFTIDLGDHKTASQSDQIIARSKADFASGNGYLFITHRDIEPLYVSYDSVGDSITTTEIEVKIRDLVGVDDGLEIDERPAVSPSSRMTAAHEYNLHNQGWNAQAYNALGGNDTALYYWTAASTTAPSSTDIWWQYKDSNEILNVAIAFRLATGNSPAPKGYRILDAFNQVRDFGYPTVVGYNNLPPDSFLTVQDTTTTVETISTGGVRPELTEFFTGRVWYAGTRYSNFTGNLYFSKIIESVADFGVCHQVNDPTSENFYELLSSDGGVIRIPEASEIVYIKAIDNVLVVFATNGIWTVSGADFSGFQADNYQVTKISEIGASSGYSFVSIDGFPIWWNIDGIYILTSSGSGFEVQNITNQTIKTFYNDIPPVSRSYAQGVYNKFERTVTWVYNSETPSEFERNFEYNKMLVFNIDTQSFSPHTISDSHPKIIGLVDLRSQSSITSEEQVDDSSDDTVVDSSIDNVVATKTVSTAFSSVNKYLTKVNDTLTFSEEKDSTYVDWYTFDSVGINYSSYFFSGYKLRGDSMRDFNTSYATFTSKTEDSSGFLVQGWWDYAINTDSGRVTASQSGYKHRANQAYSSRRLKFRGNGKVLQYKLYSLDNRPFELSGWAAFDTIDGEV